ncbi:MAG: TOBE domain-containing protein [Candidatus Coproplasma sp.]
MRKIKEKQSALCATFGIISRCVKKDGENLVLTFANNETQGYNLKNMRKIDEAYLDGEEHEVTLGIRGENIVLDEAGLTTTLTIKEILGNTTQMFVKVAPDAPNCIVCLSERNDIKADDVVKIKFDEKKIHLFDKETEFAIMSREFGN